MNSAQNNAIFDTYVQQIKTKHSQNNQLIKKLEETKKEYETLVPKLEIFRDKLSMDVMVPIPSSSTPLAFMEGTAVHTNELLVTLGSKYLAKLSTKDTIDYCHRKSDDISQKQKEIEQEQKLLTDRLSFLNMQKSTEEIEIVEQYDPDADKLWREQHALSIKKMKAVEGEERKKIIEKSPDDYFARLDQLEQMELEDDDDDDT